MDDRRPRGGVDPRGDNYPFLRQQTEPELQGLLEELHVEYSSRDVVPPLRISRLHHFGRPGGWEDQGEGNQCDIVFVSSGSSADTSDAEYTGVAKGQHYYHRWRKPGLAVDAVQRLVVRETAIPVLATESGTLLTTESGKLLTPNYLDPAGPPSVIAPSDGELDPHTVYRQPDVISSVETAGMSTPATKPLILEAGDGISLKVTGRTITMSRVPVTVCEDADTAVRSIGGAKPDRHGGVFIAADGCLEVSAMLDGPDVVPGALMLGEHCTPSLSCDDLVEVYNVRIRDLLARAQSLGTVMADLRERYVEILTQVQALDSCVSSSPISLQAVRFAVPTPEGEPARCMITLTVGLGNNTLTYWNNISLEVKFSWEDGAAPTTEPGASYGTKTHADGMTFALIPLFPTTTIDYPCVPPYRVVSASMSLLIQASEGNIPAMTVCAKAFANGETLPLNLPTQHVVCRAV